MGFNVLKPTASCFVLGLFGFGWPCRLVLCVCSLVLWGFLGLFGLCWVLCGLVCVLFVYAPLTLSIWLWLVTPTQGVPVKKQN